MDTSEELILIVDSQDKMIGQKPRSEIKKEDIYRVSSLWVFNKNKDLLVAQRPMWKSHGPGRWTESVVGTVAAGETYESNLVKEASEEIGIQVDIGELEFIAKEYYESKNGRMFASMYAVVLDENDPVVNLNLHEVPAVERLSYKDIVSELALNSDRFDGGFDKYYFQVWAKVQNL